MARFGALYFEEDPRVAVVTIDIYVHGVLSAMGAGDFTRV
jgi:hypothetical protein